MRYCCLNKQNGSFACNYFWRCPGTNQKNSRNHYQNESRVQLIIYIYIYPLKPTIITFFSIEVLENGYIQYIKDSTSTDIFVNQVKTLLNTDTNLVFYSS